MKFGVREICDVVLKARTAQKVGNKMFFEGEPVIYFDTLKTSSMEGAATTVYAQGGRGNARLMAWEGERTVTFTMEDALISPAGFMILSGAGLVEADEETTIYQHVAETTNNYVKCHMNGNDYAAEFDAAGTNNNTLVIGLKQPASSLSTTKVYVMLATEGDVISEPYEATVLNGKPSGLAALKDAKSYVKINADKAASLYGDYDDKVNSVVVDYYVAHSSNAQQIDITPDKFGGYYYLEASTLFKNTDGVDMPAEFIIPKCKIQSNFTFTMASSGDPSTFTFTIDAFPAPTKFDSSKDVLAAIQIIGDSEGVTTVTRDQTSSAYDINENGQVVDGDGNIVTSVAKTLAI